MSDFSPSQPHSASAPPAPPVPAVNMNPVNMNSRPRKTQNPQPATSNWLSATNGITDLAQQQYVPPQEEAMGQEGGKSRMEMIQEYMRAYQSGEVGRAREVSRAQGGREVNGVDVNDAQAQEQQQYLLAQPHPAHPLHPSHPQQAPVDLTPEAAAYRSFLAGAQHRRLQRHDLAVRDGIWVESITRARTRLAAVNEEKATLEAKLVAMEREREVYKVRNAVEISVVDDEREERRWREWLRVQRGVEVRPFAAGLGVGRGEVREREEEEMGGVDI